MTDLQAKALTRSRLIQYYVRFRGLEPLIVFRFIDGQAQVWSQLNMRWRTTRLPTGDCQQVSEDFVRQFQRRKAVKMLTKISVWLLENDECSS